MKTLVDTCVIIDLFRKFPPAVEFFNTLKSQPYISSLTVTELYAGAKNKKKIILAENFIENAIIIDVDEEIAQQGGELLRQYGPSHSIDLPDAIIAATVQIHELKLATCNIKHFPMISGIQRPYPHS